MALQVSTGRFTQMSKLGRGLVAKGEVRSSSHWSCWLWKDNFLSFSSRVLNERLCGSPCTSGHWFLGWRHWASVIDTQAFSIDFTLVLCLCQDEPLFFTSILSSVSLNHHLMLPSAYVCDERSGSLETTLILASFMLWFLTYSKLFSLSTGPAAGFLLLFLFLLFALQIREKNSFPVFFISVMRLGAGRKPVFKCIFLDAQKTGTLTELLNLLLR